MGGIPVGFGSVFSSTTWDKVGREGKERKKDTLVVPGRLAPFMTVYQEQFHHFEAY